MSWSISQGPVLVEGFDTAIDATHEAANVAAQNPSGVEPAAMAVDIAKQIVASGLIAKPGQKVACTLSGHANLEHEPVGGWSNDTINISVYQSS